MYGLDLYLDVTDQKFELEYLPKFGIFFAAVPGGLVIMGFQLALMMSNLGNF